MSTSGIEKLSNDFKDLKSPDLLKGKRIFRSEELFLNEREVLIVHGESQYRLQMTKAGKLILIK